MYHAMITPDHPQTTSKQTRNLVAVYCWFWLSVFALFLVYLPSVPPVFVVLLLFISGTNHRIDRTQQRCRLRARPAPRAHVYSFLFHLFVFFPLYFFLSLSFCPFGTLSSYLLTRHLVHIVNLTKTSRVFLVEHHLVYICTYARIIQKN